MGPGGPQVPDKTSAGRKSVILTSYKCDTQASLSSVITQEAGWNTSEHDPRINQVGGGGQGVFTSIVAAVHPHCPVPQPGKEEVSQMFQAQYRAPLRGPEGQEALGRSIHTSVYEDPGKLKQRLH